MPEPHRESIESALKTVKELGELSDKLRSDNSEIHRAYRTILRALEGNLTNAWVVAEALTTLKASVERISADYYGDAIGIGTEQAERDLKIYDLGDLEQPTSREVMNASVASTMALVKLQSDRTTSVAMLDLGEELIVGDESRHGILTAAPVIGEMAFWITSLAVVAYTTGIGKKMGEDAKRQAVAQVDSNTTPTCLRVHGQVVGLDEDFTLTGTPRYADKMQSSPFHRGCRTVSATIMAKFLRDDVTKDMRKEAIEQEKKPKPSKLKDRAHYKVVGKKVQEFRAGRWHKYRTYDTNIQAREAAARLNKARRS